MTEQKIEFIVSMAYNIEDYDPHVIATQITDMLEKELKRIVPSVGEAFSSIINGEGLSWLDPNE
jgi:hypothetical protein